MLKIDKLYIYSDGGARGNPGPGAIGIIICDKHGNILEKQKDFIGCTTNNRAEYLALIRALEAAPAHYRKEIYCFLDSELVVRQLNKVYRVKNKILRELLLKVRELEGMFEKITYTHVPRTNKKIVLADKLVNQALNEVKGK